MIEVTNLRKTFYVHKKAPGLRASFRSLFHREKTAKHAVKGATFRVEEGEILGLIGANGAGKTTLVKMLSGIIHPTSGDARVLGHVPWERSNELRRQVALIMGQKAQLWWDLPAADCFLLLRDIYQLPEQEYRTSLDKLSSMLGVKDVLNVQIRRLSLGERMKMELIAALLHSPRVLYLDEPTIGLDLTAQKAVRDFILEYRSQRAPAMILTSHYMEDIERLCKRIIIIREGEIVYDGGLRTVVEQYATEKTVTAHLKKNGELAVAKPEVARLGTVAECNAVCVKLRVPRDRVAEAAQALLHHYEVADITIEEPEIGQIIEQIMTARGGSDAGGPGAPESLGAPSIAGSSAENEEEGS